MLQALGFGLRPELLYLGLLLLDSTVEADGEIRRTGIEDVDGGGRGIGCEQRRPRGQVGGRIDRDQTGSDETVEMELKSARHPYREGEYGRDVGKGGHGEAEIFRSRGGVGDRKVIGLPGEPGPITRNQHVEACVRQVRLGDVVVQVTGPVRRARGERDGALFEREDDGRRVLRGQTDFVGTGRNIQPVTRAAVAGERYRD